MNLLHDLLLSVAAQRVGWALVHFLWQGALLAALLALTLRLLARRTAQLRYLAACLTLLLMLAAPVATALLLRTPPAPASLTPIFAAGRPTAIGLRVDLAPCPSTSRASRPTTSAFSSTSIP